MSGREEYDACIEMHVADAIEHASTDKIKSALEWLGDHGFIRRTVTHRVQFVNYNFKICDAEIAVTLEYNVSYGTWTCTGELISDIEIFKIINGIIGGILKIYGISEAFQTSSCQFNADASRISILAERFANWMKSCIVGNHVNPKQALENYCRAFISAIDEIKAKCKEHTAEWWSCSYLTGEKPADE